jgi:hypothetical protein
MTEKSSKAMSTRVNYDQPVSATEHDATTPDSHDKIHLGANRQANGQYTSSISISGAECEIVGW